MSRLWDMLFGWEEVLITDNMDKYIKMKTELNNKGIKTRSKFVNSENHRGIGSMRHVRMYYLYVKKEKKLKGE